MGISYGKFDKTAVQAKYDAQKIAFGPIMFQAAKSLRDLGILEVLKKNRKGITIEEIANKISCSHYGVKVLLEAGLSLELVTVENDNFYLTKTGWFILEDELTRVNMDFTNDVNYKGMFSLSESIKTGKPTGLKPFGEWDTVYEGLSKLPENVQKSWFAFDHFYSDYAFDDILPIIFKDKPQKILDIGGNTGKFAMTCAEYDNDVSITILDLPGQLEKMYKNVEKTGFANRIHGHSVNLLDHSVPYPVGFDFIWMSQFLDCFSQEEIVSLLKRSRDAMSESSALYILETYWDKQRFEASTYCLHATSLYFTNIANGNSQMYHSEDMLRLIDKAGLHIEETYEDIGVAHTLLKCKINP